MAPTVHTKESIESALEDDDKVKVAGFDVDGMLRGKIISKKKFLTLLESGFGFCSVIFGWDMHDTTYSKELLISNKENGYRDLVAKIDIQSFRRIPWEDAPAKRSNGGVPFFLVSFHDPDTKEAIAPCPRGLVKRFADKAAEKGWKAMAGAEYEFYVFEANPKDINKDPHLQHWTTGMFGYSLTRPFMAGGLKGEWYYSVWESCSKFDVQLEGWHTESGPGVYEAALEYGEVREMADKAGLFKYAVKCLGSQYGIIPCFMAKPQEGLPGNSGHLHVSLVDKDGKNLFALEEKDPNAPYADAANLSPLGRSFLAGVLKALPSIMPVLAPTVNSYKRLVENFWAPVTVSWGLEHRAASIRLIAPPTCDLKATRLEIRTPGADVNPHFALGAILAAGLRGVEDNLPLDIPPLGKSEDDNGGERLAKSLKEACDVMMAEGSYARKILGDDFVDHFGGTRREEVQKWEMAVTDWELKRYMETV